MRRSGSNDGNIKAAGVSWQQPLMMAAMKGIRNLNMENRPLLRAAAQAFQNCTASGRVALPALAGSNNLLFKYGPPENEDEVEFSLMELGPDGNAKLNVRVTMAADREDLSGNPYVAFLLRCRLGEQDWTLEKRFSKFHTLHEQLVDLLGRDLAARLPALPPRVPSILGQNGPREIQERRNKLDLYMQGLAKLAASGPLEAADRSSGDDDSNRNILHVMKELYKFVEVVVNVVPGQGDRCTSTATHLPCA